jgi:hypothetical protein
MKETVFLLLSWIGQHTNYDISQTSPNIVLTTRHNLCALYGIQEKSQCDSSGLAGFFDKNLTVYLPTSFNIDSQHDQSKLLHELVHYVQWANGQDRQTCLGQLEVEAYDLADQWRAEKGLEPSLAVFNRILLEASCDA